MWTGQPQAREAAHPYARERSLLAQLLAKTL